MQTSSSRPVAIWVYTGVIMLLIQVVLGGITRLTGSGLSITQWDVVTGALPPLNHAQWQQAFDKYKETPQFHILNSDFTLADYKFIFFWEWFHRLWARTVGVVFLVGFAWLLWKRKMQRWMIRPLVILFLLGGLQGAVGWIMVASGLVGDAIYVAPTKLALHFVFALGLIVYTFWFALQLSVPAGMRLLVRQEPANSRDTGQGPGVGSTASTARGLIARITTLRKWTVLILVLLVFQLLYGALMAGHKAATVAPTWPEINGSWVPPSLFSEHPLLHDLIGNAITVHFIHRNLAYCLFVCVVVWTILAFRLGWAPASGLPAGGVPDFFRRLRWLPLLVVSLQVLLGISSLLTSPGIVPHHWGTFDWLAQLHQVTGLLFLLTMVGMLYLVVPVKSASL
ncbi:MAG TPA: COX15/CtaA family protein [Puia sp.]|nr:COX15/CtaA family protein [Puia sp.]